MKQILSWLLSPVYIFVFFAIFVVFHPIQMIARRFGYLPHKIVFDYLNLAHLIGLRLMAARIKISFQAPIPTNRPIIFISNHQGMFDIPLIGWAMHAHHPKFIAKIQLARGVPSVSYALRTLGSVLIDRKNPRQAIPALKNFADYIGRNNYLAVLYPEGTRTRDGNLKPFKMTGFEVLLRQAPNALVVPGVITGSFELVKNKLLPVPYGQPVKLTVLEPIEPANRDPKELFSEVESKIRTIFEKQRYEP